MNPPAWAPKRLIVPIALALAFASALKAAESRPPLDEKTRGVERAAALPELAHQSSGAPQQAAQQPRPQPAAEQQLIQPPEVTYEDGQLTIIAQNSLLSEVMKALRAALGGDVDLPAGVADQQIWVHLGPGPARRVLRDLLDGTEFNYVIQASENDPDGIRSVLLTPRSKSTGAETGPPERTAIRRMPRTGPDAQSLTGSENPAPEPVASVGPPQATSPASPPASPANGSADSASLQNPPGNSDSSPLRAGSPGSQTDQMIQQLQSMYQQRRLLQMQQNQKPTGQN